jgi:prepilin-type N-terminal cleavage/methylation domain-containing protein
MRTQVSNKANRARQSGFTLIELMVAIVVLLVGVIAVAQLVPAASFLNARNRADSSSMVYAQREMDQFVDQPLNVFSFTDQQGNVCNLGSSASYNTVVGNPVTTLAGHAAIDFSGAQVAGYGYFYADPEDTSGTSYDVRWAVISTGISGGVSSRRILLGVRKRGGDNPLMPVTLDTTVEK